MIASLMVVSLIKEEEGLRLTPYLDGAGKLTVGFGHLLSKPITREEADRLFKGDLEDAESAVKELVKVPLSQHQYDALVDFAFQFGRDKLANSGMLKELNDGHYNEAIQRMSMWNKVRGPDGELKESRGLKLRRLRDLNVWNSGDYSEVEDSTL